MSKARSALELEVIVDRLQAEIATLRQSRRRLVEAHSVDRRALERALHDGVQQRLVALGVDIQHLARLVDRDPAGAKAHAAEMAVSLREAMAEAALLAQALYPPVLDSRGLATSLRSAVSAHVTVLVDDAALVDASPTVSAAIYWSCAEALASAPAGSESTVVVRAEDAGVMFEVTVAERPAPALVDRLRDRAEALDGRLIVRDQDIGSRIQGWLPLSR